MDGEIVGLNDGTNVGVEDGWNVGDEGTNVGCCVGKDGDKVGLRDGADGWIAGITDGKYEGGAVGTFEGEKLIVGEAVGKYVGSDDGSNVGEIDGGSLYSKGAMSYEGDVTSVTLGKFNVWEACTNDVVNFPVWMEDDSDVVSLWYMAVTFDDAFA